MTLDEAITLLTTAKEGFPSQNTEPYYKALELGLEALKWRRHCERVNAPSKYELLPGETRKRRTGRP